MARCLFTVEDRIVLSGRGLMLVPGIVTQGEERFRVGDPIQIRRPDGSVLEWKIGALPMVHVQKPLDTVVVLMDGLNENDVPVGAQIWSVDHTSDSGN